MYQLSVEQARAGGRRSAELRKQRSEERKQLLAAIAILSTQHPPPPPEPTVDPIAERLARTLREKLDLLDQETDPKSIASLARGIRELRETWHMVTGQPRPGLSREERRPVSVWDGPPTALAPPPCGVDTPTNGGARGQ